MDLRLPIYDTSEEAMERVQNKKRALALTKELLNEKSIDDKKKNKNNENTDKFIIEALGPRKKTKTGFSRLVTWEQFHEKTYVLEKILKEDLGEIVFNNLVHVHEEGL